MLITDRFIYLHEPKTGGTFVTETLMKLHRQRGDTVETRYFQPGDPVTLPPDVVVKLMQPNQHGRRSEIPAEQRHKPILATIRSPYDRYVSQYEFAWWKIEPELFGAVADVRAEYPAYPELTFAEFVELANCRLLRCPAADLGFHTQQFIDYFFDDPEAIYPQFDEAYVHSEACRRALAPLHFVHTEHLNIELHAFLLTMGCDPAEIAFILDAEKIFPPEGGRTPDQTWERYYTPELKAVVRQRERWLFSLFPEFEA